MPNSAHHEIEEEGVLETVKETLVDDEVPVDKKAPGSAFGLVALSYPVVLILGVVLFAMLFWMIR